MINGIYQKNQKKIYREVNILRTPELFLDYPPLIGDILELLHPETLLSPVGKVSEKTWIILLQSAPGEEIDNPHESQRFDQGKGSFIEFPELSVPGEEQIHFHRTFTQMPNAP